MRNPGLPNRVMSPSTWKAVPTMWSEIETANWFRVLDERDRLRAELDAANVTIARVRALHKPNVDNYTVCQNDDQDHPCDTIAALDGSDTSALDTVRDENLRRRGKP